MLFDFKKFDPSTLLMNVQIDSTDKEPDELERKKNICDVYVKNIMKAKHSSIFELDASISYSRN